MILCMTTTPNTPTDRNAAKKARAAARRAKANGTTLAWVKDTKPGRYVTTCGTYAVEADGYETRVVRDDSQHGGRNAREQYDYNGVRGNEWAAVVVATNENVDWFDTMTEARAECERHARNA